MLQFLKISKKKKIQTKKIRKKYFCHVSIFIIFVKDIIFIKIRYLKEISYLLFF